MEVDVHNPVKAHIRGFIFSLVRLFTSLAEIIESSPQLKDRIDRISRRFGPSLEIFLSSALRPLLLQRLGRDLHSLFHTHNFLSLCDQLEALDMSTVQHSIEQVLAQVEATLESITLYEVECVFSWKERNFSEELEECQGDVEVLKKKLEKELRIRLEDPDLIVQSVGSGSTNAYYPAKLPQFASHVEKTKDSTDSVHLVMALSGPIAKGVEPEVENASSTTRVADQEVLDKLEKAMLQFPQKNPAQLEAYGQIVDTYNFGYASSFFPDAANFDDLEPVDESCVNVAFEGIRGDLAILFIALPLSTKVTDIIEMLRVSKINLCSEGKPVWSNTKKRFHLQVFKKNLPPVYNEDGEEVDIPPRYGDMEECLTLKDFMQFWDISLLISIQCLD